jgi:hypothetical protein
MAISNIIALFIVITTAATLHARGMTDIQTSAQAAEALRSVAGPFTFVVFATGIIGTGVLTLPVLVGSAAYALGETPVLACWPGAPATAGQGIPRDNRGGHDAWRCAELLADRSDQGVVLERGTEWCRRRAGHGHSHGHGHGHGHDDVSEHATGNHG